jgi:hypothetical protein
MDYSTIQLQKINMNNIESIIEEVIRLRDSDSHVCEYHVWQQNGEPNTEKVPVCSCEQYDQVIDRLDDMLEDLEKLI